MSSARLYALPASLIYSPLTHKTNILRLYLVDFALIHVVDCCVATARAEFCIHPNLSWRIRLSHLLSAHSKKGSIYLPRLDELRFKPFHS